MTDYILRITDGVPSIVGPSVPVPVPPTAPRLLAHRGSNLCGGGTYWGTWPASGPASGTHYLFPSTQDVDILLAAGMNTFRLLFTWEALQPTTMAVIGAQYATYFQKFTSLVSYITSKGATVILDIHGDNDAGFAAYYGTRVGGEYNNYTVNELLADLWRQLAIRYKSNPLVWFGLTNEPHDIPASVWFGAVKEVVEAIRLTGSTNKIVCPGTDWTGAGTWLNNNAAAWDVADKNTMVQVHMYMDQYSGGGTEDIVNSQIGVTRLRDVTEWCRGKGLKLLLAEVGFSASNPIAAETWKNLHDYMLSNSDVVMGFTWWAYGPPAWWSGYRFTLCNNSKQLQMIQSSLK